MDEPANPPLFHCHGEADALDERADELEIHARPELLDDLVDTLFVLLRCRMLSLSLHHCERTTAVAGGTRLDQPASIRIDIADEEGAGAIPVVAIQVDRDVHADDVAILKRPIVGDAVHDHLVHGRAHGPGESDAHL